MKTRALEEMMGEFVKSGRYIQLPTEAEKAEAEKTLKEAKEAELGRFVRHIKRTKPKFPNKLWI